MYGISSAGLSDTAFVELVSNILYTISIHTQAFYWGTYGENVKDGEGLDFFSGVVGLEDQSDHGDHSSGFVNSLDF